MPKKDRRLLLTACCLCSLFLFSLAAAGGQPAIYRWVDENGTVHFSDAPPPGTQAQPADLPQITIVPAKKIKPGNKNSEADKDDKQKDPQQTTATFADLRLVRPQPEENLWGTGGTVTAEVDFSGRLPRGYAIQFVLDGKALKPVRKKIYVIREVIRGEHSLYAQIIEIKSGKVMAKTDPVTFYLKQATVKMHNNG